MLYVPPYPFWGSSLPTLIHASESRDVLSHLSFTQSLVKRYNQNVTFHSFSSLKPKRLLINTFSLLNHKNIFEMQKFFCIYFAFFNLSAPSFTPSLHSFAPLCTPSLFCLRSFWSSFFFPDRSPFWLASDNVPKFGSYCFLCSDSDFLHSMSNMVQKREGETFGKHPFSTDPSSLFD